MFKVVIAGYGEMFTNIIAGTLDSGAEIVGVLRQDTVKYPAIIRKIKDILNPTNEYNYIKSYKLKEINAHKGINSKEFKKKLLELNPDILLVASWGEKIKKEIYDIPKIASINVHPSLLPKYRGANPYYWVINNGEKKSGISFHLIDENFDRGAIIAQDEIEILPDDTGDSLKKRTVLKARGVVRELLKDLNEDIIIPLTQIEEKASYYSTPSDLEISCDKSAEENKRKARAIFPWGNAYFYINTIPFKVFHENVGLEENLTVFDKVGTIISTDYKKGEIKLVCADNKIMKFSNIEMYKPFGKILAKLYLKFFVKVGDIV